MNREIKFRAWDKKHKTMWTNIVPMLLKFIADPDCELMQFIGLKDKNGIEIYEGDRVKRGGEFVPDGEWGIVEFTGCSFGLNRESFIKKHQTGQWIDCPEQYFANYGEMEWCEVIGNIYENPELLKE